MSSDQLLPSRERLLRDTFTPAENFLFGCIVALFLISTLGADPRSYWILGALLIIGCVTPALLKTHEHTHPFFIDLLWPRFWFLSAPVWLLFAQYTLGLIQKPLRPLSAGSLELVALHQPSSLFPTTIHPAQSWLTLLSFGTSYLILLCLYLVPKSRSFFEKLLPRVCFIAVCICIYGYLQKALNVEKPPLTGGTNQTDFFAFFPYDGHWAAFALIWCVGCSTMALLTSRYDPKGDFFQTNGPWYLTGALLLGASGFFVQAKWPSTFLIACFSWMMLIVSLNFLKLENEKHRKTICGLSAALAIISFTGAIIRFFNHSEDTLSSTSAQLKAAALEMFRDQPLFGWGLDAYKSILPFYADDELLGLRYDRATSDTYQILAEFGIVGILPITAIIIYLLIRYVRGKHNLRLTNHLLIACLSIFVLSFFDSPFMSPAVFISFFFILFSSLRWAEVSRNSVDEVDAKPNLVTPASKRSVPFVDPQNRKTEKFK